MNQLLIDPEFDANIAELPADVQADRLIGTARKNGEAPLIFHSVRKVNFFGGMQPLFTKKPLDTIFLLRVKSIPVETAVKNAILKKLGHSIIFNAKFDHVSIGGVHVIQILDFDFFPIPVEVEPAVRQKLATHNITERHPLTGMLVPANVQIHAGASAIDAR